MYHLYIYIYVCMCQCGYSMDVFPYTPVWIPPACRHLLTRGLDLKDQQVQNAERHHVTSRVLVLTSKPQSRRLPSWGEASKSREIMVVDEHVCVCIHSNKQYLFNLMNLLNLFIYPSYLSICHLFVYVHVSLSLFVYLYLI